MTLTILAQLPDRIRAAYVERATRLNYPVEAVLEMALAGWIPQAEADLE